MISATPSYEANPVVPATPPPGRERKRVRPRKRRPGRSWLPGARWRLPAVEAGSALSALAFFLCGCSDTSAVGWAGPVVLAVSVFGLCLRPVRAEQPRRGPCPATPELIDDGNARFWHVLT